MATQNAPLVTIVGQTASGKSRLGLEVARRFNGEIICADSRTVYRGMDTGTAKPSAQDRQAVPHHGLDVVEIGTVFTAADFQALANAAIADITGRGKLPILVGGTGLYVDAVLLGYRFRPAADAATRHELTALSVPELQRRLLDMGLELPANSQNPRHLIRAIETGSVQSARRPLRENTLVIGLDVPADELKTRIRQRAGDMIAKGLEQEVKALADEYGWNHDAMKAVGYREWQARFAGRQSPDETTDLIIRHTWDYARRQKTWFKRHQFIQWVSVPTEAITIVTQFLDTR